MGVRECRAVAWSRTAARGGGGESMERCGHTGGDRLAVVARRGGGGLALAAWMAHGGVWAVAERRRRLAGERRRGMS